MKFTCLFCDISQESHCNNTYLFSQESWLTFYICPNIHHRKKRYTTGHYNKKMNIFWVSKKCLFVKQKYLPGFWFKAASIFFVLKECILVRYAFVSCPRIQKAFILLYWKVTRKYIVWMNRGRKVWKRIVCLSKYTSKRKLVNICSCSYV